jgi:molybdopterin-binding protein
MPSKISARNQFRGKILKITKDPIVTYVEVEITSPIKISSVITSGSADELSLKVGDNVTAIIKSTEVMIGKE